MKIRRLKSVAIAPVAVLLTGLLIGVFAVQAEDTVPWKGEGAGQVFFDTFTVREEGVATHIGRYTEIVWLTSETTGIVEITAANGDKLYGFLVHLSPTKVQVTFDGGTGRFRDAAGGYVATLTVDLATFAFSATSTGTITTVGTNKK